MNTKEAEFLLAGLRSEDRVVDDSQLAEALDLAKSDPELKQWVKEQQELDQVISENLRDIALPADLLPSIMAGTKMTQTRRKQPHPIKTVALMAALLAILIALISVYQVQSGSISDFSTAMIDEIEQLDSFEYLSSNQAEIRDWLEAHSGSSQFQVPTGMEGFDTAECHLFEWKGRRASLNRVD